MMLKSIKLVERHRAELEELFIIVTKLINARPSLAIMHSKFHVNTPKCCKDTARIFRGAKFVDLLHADGLALQKALSNMLSKTELKAAERCKIEFGGN